MKATALLAGALLASLSFMGACDSKDVITTDIALLPKEAQATLDRYYKDVTISQIKIDKEALGNDDYEVMLSNGTNIEFDDNGTIREIQAGINDSAPSAFIPKSIINYINAHYPQQTVIGIDFGKKHTEVTLNTGIELKFDGHGNFIELE